MLKRGMVWLVVFVLVAGTLVACSTDTKKPSAGANNQNDEEIDYASMEVELTFSSVFSDSQFDEVIGQYVEDEFPNYTIKHVSSRDFPVEELVVGGSNFDIYIGRASGIVNTFDPLNLTYDLTELSEKHGVDLDSFAPGYIESGTFDEKLYALPIFNDSLVLFYNRELFERFGVDPPTDGMTWEETLAIAHEMERSEDGIQYMGLWMSPKHFFRMNSLSEGFIDLETNEVTVDTDNWKRVFELFAELSKNSDVQDMAKENFPSHDHFRGANRNAAMYLFITEWIATSEVQVPLDWDIVSMPVFTDHPDKGTQPYANYAGITSISKNQDAAMQVLKYLTSEKYQMEISAVGKISPLKSQKVQDAAFQDHPDDDKNFGAVYVNDNAPMREIHPLEAIVIDIMDEHIKDLITGEKDINSVLRAAQDEAQIAVDQEINISK